MNQKTKNNLIKASIFSAGIGTGILIISKLYDNLRKDHNRLVDKCNNLVDFIDKHDFYEKMDEPQKTTIQSIDKPKMILLSNDYDKESNKRISVYKDNRGLKWCVYS